MGQLTSRQEVIHSELRDPKVRNWLCANMAVRDVSAYLAKCIHLEISSMHKEMRRTIGESAKCNKNCSRINQDGNFNNWCTSCHRWRKEILSYCSSHYRSQINWSRLHSTQWSTNPYEVARAFIPRAHRLYYKSAEFHEDYRFILSFLHNCLKCSAPEALCDKLWRYHASVRRKNLWMRLSDHELQTLISALQELLSLPQFGDTCSLVQKLGNLLNTTDDDEGCHIM